MLEFGKWFQPYDDLHARWCSAGIIYVCRTWLPGDRSFSWWLVHPTTGSVTDDNGYSSHYAETIDAAKAAATKRAKQVWAE